MPLPLRIRLDRRVLRDNVFARVLFLEGRERWPFNTEWFKRPLSPPMGCYAITEDMATWDPLTLLMRRGFERPPPVASAALMRERLSYRPTFPTF